MDIPDLADQIAAVSRELALRERLYPKWVACRKNGLTAEKARFEIACMREVLKTLRHVKHARAVEAGFDH